MIFHVGVDVERGATLVRRRRELYDVVLVDTREGVLARLGALVLGASAGCSRYKLEPPEGFVEVHAYRLFRKLPGVALGVLLAAISYLILQLLSSGPRAFIYFQF